MINIFKHSKEKHFEYRRFNAIKTVVEFFKVPLCEKSKYDLDEIDFNKEEWLVEQLEKIPRIVLSQGRADVTLDKEIEQCENTRMRKELKDLWNLKAELINKDAEIESLKAVLHFSKEGEKEWELHKGIFNFIVNKEMHIKAENAKLYAENVKLKRENASLRVDVKQPYKEIKAELVRKGVI